MFSAYIKAVAVFLIFSAFAELIMPESRFKKYIAILLGFLMVVTVLKPIGSLLAHEESDFLRLIEENERKLQMGEAAVEADEEAQNRLVTQMYKENVKEAIKNTLFKEGIFVVEVEVTVNENYNDSSYGEIISVAVRARLPAEEGQETIIRPVFVKGFDEPTEGTSVKEPDIVACKEKIQNAIMNTYSVAAEHISVEIG